MKLINNIIDHAKHDKVAEKMTSDNKTAKVEPAIMAKD